MDPRQHIKKLLQRHGSDRPKNLPEPGSNRTGEDFIEHPDLPLPAVRMSGTGTEKLAYYTTSSNNPTQNSLDYAAWSPVRGLATLSGKDPMTQTLTGAGIGAMGGLGLALARRLLGHRNAGLMNGLLAGAALGGITGAGGGWLYRNNVQRKDYLNQLHETRNPVPAEYKRIDAKYQREKAAGFGGSEQSFIINKLLSASDISDLQKRHMVNLVSQLSPQQASALSGALRRFTGGALGYFIAQYLLKFNLGGRILSAIVGGALIGSGRPANKNVFNQTVF